MSSAPKNNIKFLKMSACGNDFIIVDGREKNIEILPEKIAKLSKRNVIGCDQFVILRNSNLGDCFMEIYNLDGSKSGACGNATRCVAALLFEEKNQNLVNIETEAGVLECKKLTKSEISVKMTKPKFFDSNFKYDGYEFLLVDVGNPHAVCFVDEELSDENFFKIGKEVESHQNFVNRTNVEFAKIIDDNLIEVRVFERGVGETLACGTGACAVGVLAIKNNLVKTSEVVIRFKGGDIKIGWNKSSEIIMSGGFEKIFEGEVFEEFLN